METLNELETAILNRLGKDYPLIKTHIPYLTVIKRKVTGVGMYINLAYVEDAPPLAYISQPYLSTTGYLKMDGLQDGLIDDTTTTNGKIEMIELVTYAEPWDGVIRPFRWDDKL